MTAALWFVLKFYSGGVLAVYSSMRFMGEDTQESVAWAFCWPLILWFHIYGTIVDWWRS